MNTSKSYVARKTEEIESLKLNCFSFLQDDMMPSRYTCDGININPPLYIEHIPEGTKSFAVIVEDPDVPHGSFCHWVAWNIPVTHQIKEKENRGIFGINDFGHHDYNGPHPFSLAHRYYFKVYALDCTLDIPVSSTKWELKKAMNHHIIGFGLVTGKYRRQHTHYRNAVPARTKPLSEELRLLLNVKDRTCVSILLPLHQLSAGEKKDKLYLAKAIKEASDQLTVGYPEEPTTLIHSLTDLQERISIEPGDQAIGLYVSKEFSFYTGFSFQVMESLAIGQGFRLKEMLLKQQYSIPYNVLYLDEKEIRLYTGKLKNLIEVKYSGFPVFLEEHQKAPAAFPETKHLPLTTRHSNFLAKADELLFSHLHSSEVFVLCGPRKQVTEFFNHTLHAGRIVSILCGRYGRFTEKDFGELAWPYIKTYVEQKAAGDLDELSESMSEGLAEEGIVRAWDAVATDRAETLLLEKNFSVKGFIENENGNLYLHPPKFPHVVYDDAVNELIRMALNKNIRIVFVEDGVLSRHLRIAVITKF